MTGQQFAWNVRYPGKDGVFGKTDYKLVDPSALNFIGLDKHGSDRQPTTSSSQNQLFLPEGRPVRVRAALPGRDPQLLPARTSA